MAPPVLFSLSGGAPPSPAFSPAFSPACPSHFQKNGATLHRRSQLAKMSNKLQVFIVFQSPFLPLLVYLVIHRPSQCLGSFFC